LPKVISAIGLQREPGTVYVVSYSAGVDSTTIMIMALQGRIPVDYFVIADPGNEMPESYEYLEYIRPYIEKAGLPLKGA